MKGNFKASSALALLESTKVAAPAVKSFGSKVAKTFTGIAKADQTTAVNAILVGMSLPVLKASLPKGTFTTWMKSNLTQGKIWSETTAIKNASFYTRLACKVLDETKVSGNEVLAITNGKTVLGKPGKDAQATKLVKAITDFVGERSLNELLETYDIKKGAGGGGGGNNLPALPADDATLLQDIAEAMLSLRKTVTDPNTLKRLTAGQISQLEKQLDDTQEDFRKALVAMRAK